MKGLLLQILQVIYYKMTNLFFVVKTNTPALHLKIRFDVLKILNFKGNNRIGKNCKFLADTPKSNSFTLGKYSWLRDNVEVNLPQGTKMTLGDHVSIQDNCKLIGDISIGSGSIFAPSVFVSSGSHYAFNQPELSIRQQDRLALSDGFKSKPIIIGEDVWVGYHVVINKGSHISKGCVIGSGARVSGYVPPYSVIVNNNKHLKWRLQFSPLASITASQNHLPYFYEGFYNPSFINEAKIQCYGSGTILLTGGAYSQIEIEGSTNDSPIMVVLNNTIISDNLVLMGKHTINIDKDYKTISLPNHMEDLKKYNILRLMSKDLNTIISVRKVSLS